MGQQNLTFAGLPFAGKEVATLVAALPGTKQFLDRAFSLNAIKPQMNDYSILHFATHAAFFPGQPEDSFILFGNGDRATLAAIQDWSLPDVDLVVLSACQTGVGLDAYRQTLKLGNGEEILGLGYQFQRAGAKATIASLWEVDDGGTQALMNAFYQALKSGNLTKTQALQQAQMELLTSKTSSSN